jgi:hypothetical protein
MHSCLRSGALAVLAAGLMVTTAFAGSKISQPVSINDADKQANGDLGFARNTADTVQYIGCYVNDTGNGGAGICQARDAAGVTRSCSTTNDFMVDTIKSLKGDSSLYFRWNEDGNCTMVIVRNRSSYAPK